MTIDFWVFNESLWRAFGEGSNKMSLWYKLICFETSPYKLVISFFHEMLLCQIFYEMWSTRRPTDAAKDVIREEKKKIVVIKARHNRQFLWSYESKVVMGIWQFWIKVHIKSLKSYHSKETLSRQIYPTISMNNYTDRIMEIR